jgi:hypothetical protein
VPLFPDWEIQKILEKTNPFLNLGLLLRDGIDQFLQPLRRSLGRFGRISGV